MTSIPPEGTEGRGPWRNPFEHRRLVTVRRGPRGVYEVTVAAGAGVPDLVEALAALPSVVYVDHRAAAPGDSAAVLVFHVLPDGPDGVSVRPAPVGAAPGARVPTAVPAPAGVRPEEPELGKAPSGADHPEQPRELRGAHPVHGVAHRESGMATEAAGRAGRGPSSGW